MEGRGASKKKINKDHIAGRKSSTSDVKEKIDANPITASEHDDALKTVIAHEQSKLDSKNFKGFDLVEKEFVLNSGKKLKLILDYRPK